MQMARLIHQTKEDLCILFGTDDPIRVIFTQNVTHALNQALFGLLQQGFFLSIWDISPWIYGGTGSLSEEDI